ncbi:hypothetical protein ACJRO7_004434 [Eucalyptus globulus]|uniref:Uncharacterized protein n=1 Tax=Eucalyptus globulus TaxID=34317 RepID=A0ABD3IZE0_EUCGL
MECYKLLSNLRSMIILLLLDSGVAKRKRCGHFQPPRILCYSARARNSNREKRFVQHREDQAARSGQTDRGTVRVRLPSMIASYFRAVLEGLVKEHFGAKIVDRLFTWFEKKIKESPLLSDPRYKSPGELLILLNRNVM